MLERRHPDTLVSISDVKVRWICGCSSEVLLDARRQKEYNCALLLCKVNAFLPLPFVVPLLQPEQEGKSISSGM